MPYESSEAPLNQPNDQTGPDQTKPDQTRPESRVDLADLCSPVRSCFFLKSAEPRKRLLKTRTYWPQTLLDVNTYQHQWYLLDEDTVDKYPELSRARCQAAKNSWLLLLPPCSEHWGRLVEGIQKSWFWRPLKIKLTIHSRGIFGSAATRAKIPDE